MLARRSRAKNPTEMQLENRSMLLQLLREHRHACRKDLAEMSGLTGAAVTNLIRDLIDAGVVSEDHDYTGPLHRNAVPLKINYEDFLVIGVSIRRGRLSEAVSDLSGTIMERKITEFPLSQPAAVVLENIRSAIAHYIEKYSSNRKVVGIGVSVPGPVNLQTGEISYLTNAPGWTAVPIRQFLTDSFDLPVILDEDANAAALAERWFGCVKVIRT